MIETFRSQFFFFALALAASPLAAGASGGHPLPNYCGWFDNPSPNNAILHDGNTEWIISRQGEHEAIGAWPNFSEDEFVRTGLGSYGYGCACLRMDICETSRKVKRIEAAAAKPLSDCRQDPRLSIVEPENPIDDE